MLDKGRHDRVTFNTASFKRLCYINVIYNNNNNNNNNNDLLVIYPQSGSSLTKLYNYKVFIKFINYFTNITAI
jgi:hypothetical protein